MAFAALYTSRDSRCRNVEATNFVSLEMKGMIPEDPHLLKIIAVVLGVTVATGTVVAIEGTTPSVVCTDPT